MASKIVENLFKFSHYTFQEAPEVFRKAHITIVKTKVFSFPTAFPCLVRRGCPPGGQKEDTV
jgi:hypothetical protein